MTEAERTFVPAAGKHWALPFYDLMAKLLGADRARAALTARVPAGSSGRFVEIGCGTGTLLVQLKRASPAADVVGLDPDANALALARRKAAKAGLSIQLDQGFAGELPYGDASVDRVLSSLMFHHLRLAGKQQMLREVVRVLKPGGRFHMLDLGGSASVRGFLARKIHPSAALRDNGEERVLAMMAEAGLADAQVVGRVSVRVGDLLCYEASAPKP